MLVKIFDIIQKYIFYFRQYSIKFSEIIRNHHLHKVLCFAKNEKVFQKKYL